MFEALGRRLSRTPRRAVVVALLAAVGALASAATPVTGTRSGCRPAAARTCAPSAAAARPNPRAASRALTIADGPPPLRCNGFAELCDRRVDQVVFAGTHNAMAAAALGFTWPNQDYAVPRQLQDGVRALLLDTHYWERPDDYVRFAASLAPADRSAIADRQALAAPPAGVYLCHVVCTLGATPFVDTLRDIRAFLATHHDEVLILDLQDAVSPADTESAFRASGLIDDVYAHRPNTPWPTLRELIARHRRVIVGAEHAGPPPDWYTHLYSEAWDTPYDFHGTADFTCAVNRGAPSSALLLLNHWIAKRRPDRADAAQVNQLDVLLARAHQCEDEHATRPNIIAVNFYDVGDLFRAVDVLNGVAPEPPRPAVSALHG